MCHDNGWGVLVDVKWVMTVTDGLPDSWLIYISTHHCTGALTDICFISKLAGVPGGARDDQSWNPMDGVIFWYTEKGLQKLWKCVTVK